MRRSSHLATLLAIAALTLPTLARAQNAAPAQTDPLARVKALSQEAATAFEGYSFRKARRKLLAALALAAENNLMGDKELAPTLVLTGIAYVAGFNDLYRGLHYFVDALRLDPTVEVPHNLATPQLLDMFKRAKKTKKQLGQPPSISLRGSADDEGSTKTASGEPKGRGLIHVPIDTVKRGLPLPVKAEAGLDIQAHRFFLYYRPAGKVKFTKVPMKKSKGVFRASIPKEITQGRYLHYYIEAEDKRGRLAASQGSARSPNVVITK